MYDVCVPVTLSPPACNNALQLKEASVKGDLKAAATPPADVKDQSEGAPDPAVLTRVSGATHSSQASHQALVKDGAVKDVRELPPADLAVQIDPKTVSAAVAQVCSWGLPARLAPVFDWCAACSRTIGATVAAMFAGFPLASSCPRQPSGSTDLT